MERDGAVAKGFSLPSLRALLLARCSDLPLLVAGQEDIVPLCVLILHN